MEERKQTVITEYRLTEISYINHYNNRFYSKKGGTIYPSMNTSKHEYC